MNPHKQNTSYNLFKKLVSYLANWRFKQKMRIKKIIFWYFILMIWRTSLFCKDYFYCFVFFNLFLIFRTFHYRTGASLLRQIKWKCFKLKFCLLIKSITLKFVFQYFKLTGHFCIKIYYVTENFWSFLINMVLRNFTEPMLKITVVFYCQKIMFSKKLSTIKILLTEMCDFVFRFGLWFPGFIEHIYLYINTRSRLFLFQKDVPIL
jgi:hypothetical protein